MSATIERTTQMSSTHPAICGSSSLTSTPLSPCFPNWNLDAKRLSWAQGELPPDDSVKGKVLNAYIANGERCLVKEGYPSFGELKKDPARLAEWKQIECTQGLVKPE